MLEISIQEHTNNIVSKSNELIKAQSSLSSTAHKMLCSVISMIKTDDTQFQEYALRRDDYLSMIGSSSNNDDFLYKQAEELMSKPFRVDGKLFNWCSMVDFKRIPGYIIFDVHHKLKPYLLELKERGNFTQYKIMNILTLKGDYVPRLYELFVMEWNQHRAYHKDAKSHTFELKIDMLREMFEIPKSQLYADIKRHIIDKAQAQFKEKTDIKFDYKEQKMGRKVDRLIITIKENNKGSNDFLASEKAFIAHMRKNYINQDLANTTDKHTEEKLLVSVGQDGKLYNKYSNKTIDNKRSQELWSGMYKLALEDKLLILKQGKLF